MSQFRTTVDLIASVLRRCGELTDGTSPYAQQALDYLNQIQYNVVTGGTEFNLEVDEPLDWAVARTPLILELQPYVNTGTVSLTQGSEAGTFSSAPTASLAGWYLKLDSGPEVYRIASHTASATAFELDSAFPQTTASAGTFRAFKLDYDLASTYITIDEQNEKLDFIASGTTVLTATLTRGAYTPSDLATAAAAALQTADGARVYTGSYDSVTRFFTFTSNRASSGVFKPQGAGTNSYRSGWATLGFDYSNYSDAASQVSAYPYSAVIKLTEPARCYYGNYFNYGGIQGNIPGLDAQSLGRNYPLSAIECGTPSAFAIVRERSDGTLTVRFNKYPDRKMRVEFEHVPMPKDLQNNTASIPVIPRKFNRILEYGAAYYILTDKRDEKAAAYAQLATQALSAMMKVSRRQLEQTGQNFGNVIARADLMPDRRYRRKNFYGYDGSSY